MHNLELERVIEELRPKLEEYLEDQGVDASENKLFRCINPNHDDRDPSMGIIPDSDGKTLYCFGCSCNYDIFDAAHLLEDFPNNGKEWITENVFALADRYEIEHGDIQFSEEDIIELRARKLMRDVADVFNEQISVNPFASDYRKWSEELCKELEVGTIHDWKEFYTMIKARGAWLDVDLILDGIKHYAGGPGKPFQARNGRLFGQDRLTFLIRDHKGRPVGFAARNYSRTAPKPKYINTTEWSNERGAGSKVYKKGKVLYGLYKAIEERRGKTRIDIFEGYPDWISAKGIGLSQVCALGGTAFTRGHLDLLVSCGYRHINFVLDGDDEGIKRMVGDPDDPLSKGYLYTTQGVPGVKVTVSFLPFDPEAGKDERDPDAYFSTHTAEEYHRDLRIFDAFDWELEHLTQDKFEAEQVVDQLIDSLRNEMNIIIRREKAEKLASKTDIPVDDILQEFDRRFDSDTDSVIEMYLRRIFQGKNTKQKVETINELSAKLEDRSEDKTIDITQAEVISDYERFIAMTEDTKSGLNGWDCGFEQLNEATDGIPREGEWLAFAGNGNSGKTSLSLNIAWNILNLNEDAAVCYWALDDRRHIAYARWLAIETQFEINNCLRPHRSIMQNETHATSYLEARERLGELIRSGRLSIKGEETGSSVAIAERWVKEVQDRTGKPVILVADSFHNVSLAGSSEERARLSGISGWFRRSTQAHRFSAIVTMECNKLGIYREKPVLADLYGSAKMQYDLQFVGMVYNDLHARRDKAEFLWRDDLGAAHPYIEVNVEKNKLSGYKGTIVYKLYESSSRVEEVPRDRAARLKRFENKPSTDIAPPAVVPLFFESSMEMTGG